MNWNPKVKRVARIILIILATLLLALLSMCIALSNDPNHITWPIETNEPNASEHITTQQPSAEPTVAPTPTAKPDVTPEPTESEPVKESDEPVETSAQPNVVPTQRPNLPVSPPQQSQSPSFPAVVPSDDPYVMPSSEPSTLPSIQPSTEPSEQIIHLVIKINNQTSVYGEPIKSLTYTVKSASSTGVTISEIAKYITLSKEKGTDAETYAITGHCTNPKWQVKFENGIYTITKRQITVRVDSQWSYVGDTLKELTCKLENGTLARGDKLNRIVKLSTNANKNRVGTYSITGTVIDDNYEAIFTGNAEYTVRDRGNTTNPPITLPPSETLPGDGGGNGNTDPAPSEELPGDGGGNGNTDPDPSEELPGDGGGNGNTDPPPSEELPGDGGGNGNTDPPPSEELPSDGGGNDNTDPN